MDWDITDHEDYKASRDEAMRMLDSSFRDRPEGIEGLRSDSNLLAEKLIRPYPACVDQQIWRTAIIDQLNAIEDCINRLLNIRQSPVKEAYLEGYDKGWEDGSCAERPDPAPTETPTPPPTRRRSSRRVL